MKQQGEGTSPRLCLQLGTGTGTGDSEIHSARKGGREDAATATPTWRPRPRLETVRSEAHLEMDTEFMFPFAPGTCYLNFASLGNLWEGLILWLTKPSF